MHFYLGTDCFKMMFFLQSELPVLNTSTNRMLATTSTGVVSEDTWKCERQFQSGFSQAGFDDSSWAQARVLGANDGSYAARVTAISSEAKWIWITDAVEHIAHCRKTLCWFEWRTTTVHVFWYNLIHWHKLIQINVFPSEESFQSRLLELIVRRPFVLWKTN